MALTDEQDSDVVYFAIREKLPVVEFRQFMRKVTATASNSFIDKMLDNVLNDPIATVNVRTDFLKWQAGAERRPKMGTKILKEENEIKLTIEGASRPRTLSPAELTDLHEAIHLYEEETENGAIGIEVANGRLLVTKEIIKDPKEMEATKK